MAKIIIGIIGLVAVAYMFAAVMALHESAMLCLETHPAYICLQ